jgi:hypothetical protein
MKNVHKFWYMNITTNSQSNYKGVSVLSFNSKEVLDYTSTGRIWEVLGSTLGAGLGTLLK